MSSQTRSSELERCRSINSNKSQKLAGYGGVAVGAAIAGVVTGAGTEAAGRAGK